MSLISAVTARGHMRFMIKKKGGVNADVFIEFLKRLTVGATRPIFLIADCGPAHRAKTTKAFVETLGGKLRLFFLPPYSPDRNPDELVWKHLKADTVGRSAIQNYVDFNAKVISSMHSLQRNAGSAPSSKRTRSNTPPECLCAVRGSCGFSWDQFHGGAVDSGGGCGIERSFDGPIEVRVTKGLLDHNCVRFQRVYPPNLATDEHVRDPPSAEYFLDR